MKQTILSFLLTLLPLAASADAVEIDGICYNLVSKVKTAEVTSNTQKYKGTVTIPKTVTYNDVTYNVTSIGSSAFSRCVDLNSVTIPNSVTSIGGSAFYYCIGLTNITIPNSVTSIGWGAFELCEGLKTVLISDLEAWCYISFPNYSANPLSYAKHLYLKGEEINNLVIPNTVTSIGNMAFYGCSGLTSVTIPNSVTSIGKAAFYGCNGLTSITIDNSVTNIGSWAFYNCSGLTSVTIPNSVADIGEHTFDGCSGLTSIVIPNSMTSIETSAFSGCSGLTSITIPNSVTNIGDGAFGGCSGLPSITIPNSVTSIGWNAFDGCSGLTSIIIGNGIKSISSNAFAQCAELTDVYCYAEEVKYTASNAFTNSYVEYSTLHVPESAIEYYKATAPWSSFKNFVSVTDNNNYYDLSITVTNALGKVTYGTTDVTNGLQTFFVKEGSDAVLTLTPNDGFKVDKVMVNGEDRTANVVNGQLTLSNVTANLTVSVSFGVAGEFTKVTIGADKIATFCAAGDVDFTTLNLKAYTGGGFNRQTGVLTMMRVYDVPAGTGLLLKGEPGTYFVPYSQSYSVYSNLLKGVIVATNINAIEDGYVNYVLNNGSQGVGFYKVGTAGASLEAGHAYLQIPAETATSRNALKLRFDDEDEVTAIDDVLQQDGETVLYDLQGRRVKQPQRGLYISNGKKVIIK